MFSPSINRWISGLAFTTLSLVAAAALGVWTSSDSLSQSSLLVLAIGVVLALPIGVRLSQGKFDPFEPTVLFALAYGTMFIARPAVMIANGDYSYDFTPGIDVQPTFNRMLVLALFGAISFVAGYALPFGKSLAQRAPRPPREFDRPAATIVALVFAGVGVLSFLVLLVQVGGSSSLLLGGRSEGLQALDLNTPAYLVYGTILLVGPALLLFGLYRQRKTGLMLLLTVAAVMTVVVVRGSSGSRFALLPLFGCMFFLWFLSKGRRPRLITSLAVVALALVLSAGILYGRDARWDLSSTSGADYGAGFAKAVSSPTAPLDPIVNSPDTAMAPGVAAAMMIIPERLHYGYGRYVLTDLFARWIPRQIWAGKPQPTHTQVTEELARQPGRVQYQIAYSILLHGYLDFGMIGALWLLGFGVIYRALFEYVKMHNRSIPAMLIFSLGLILIVPALRDNPVDTTVLSAALFAPVICAYLLTKRRLIERRA